jgi:hypothetical protein
MPPWGSHLGRGVRDPADLERRVDELDDLRRDLDGAVVVGDVDDPVADEALLRLRERSP